MHDLPRYKQVHFSHNVAKAKFRAQRQGNHVALLEQHIQLHTCAICCTMQTTSCSNNTIRKIHHFLIARSSPQNPCINTHQPSCYSSSSTQPAPPSPTKPHLVPLKHHRNS